MKFAHVRGANISHLRSKYFTAKRFHLPERANFVGAPALSQVPQRVLFVMSGGKHISEMFCYRKTWNNMRMHIVKYLVLLDVKWNLPTFAERTFHICEENISPRSDFTCPKGQISLAHLLFRRCAKGLFFVAKKSPEFSGDFSCHQYSAFPTVLG